MAKGKSQLPMIRSLKTIARRKMNVDYYNVPVSKQKKEELELQLKEGKKQRNLAVRRLLNGAPKHTLAAVLKKAYDVPTSETDKAEITKFEKEMGAVNEMYPNFCYYTLERNYQKGIVKMNQEMFNELEDLELKIISGEEVDLAPYARQLSSS